MYRKEQCEKHELSKYAYLLDAEITFWNRVKQNKTKHYKLVIIKRRQGGRGTLFTHYLILLVFRHLCPCWGLCCSLTQETEHLRQARMSVKQKLVCLCEGNDLSCLSCQFSGVAPMLIVIGIKIWNIQTRSESDDSSCTVEKCLMIQTA